MNEKNTVKKWLDFLNCGCKLNFNKVGRKSQFNIFAGAYRKEKNVFKQHFGYGISLFHIFLPLQSLPCFVKELHTCNEHYTSIHVLYKIQYNINAGGIHTNASVRSTLLLFYLSI